MKPKVLKTWPNTKGYELARLIALDGKMTCVAIHTMVLTVFKCPRPAGMLGCHNDGNHKNNMIDNLRWDTYQGNRLDTIKHNTIARHHGEANPAAKLSALDVVRIRECLLFGARQIDLAKVWGLGPSTLSSIARRASWVT
jgi:hypothetical protein